MKQENIHKIFEEYTELVGKYMPYAQDIGKELEIKGGTSEERNKIDELKNRLLNNLESLSDEELRELQNGIDEDLSYNATKILASRNKN